MLKSILVLLGETAASAAARSYAFAAARAFDAELTGLSGIDLDFIERRTPGRAGSISYAIALEDELKRQAEAARTRLHEVYRSECETHGHPFGWLTFEGDPEPALNAAAESRDLIVTGHDTIFHGRMRVALSEMLSAVLANTPRPVVICGDEPGPGTATLVAYDGSLQAMRAIQLFALLGLGRDAPVHVTSIGPSREEAQRRTAAAVAFLRRHGYELEANPIVSNVDAAEVLRIEVADRRIGTLVMGAFGPRSWSEYIFGSTTTQLAEDPPCALFLYH
jgi:nucleotide-binding universal stress UspA family protein